MAEIFKVHHEELGSIYVPKSIAQILIGVSAIDDFSKKIMILKFHIKALEEELKLIVASNCPVHYPIRFVEDAIEILQQEILRWKGSEKNSVLEELMPMKSGFEGRLRAKESKDNDEKKGWMSSVQLLTTPIQYDDNKFDNKNQKFEGYKGSSSGYNFKDKGAGSLMPSGSGTMKNKGPVSSSTAEPEIAPIDLYIKRKDPQVLYSQPQQKKQRLCWSPELHTQFVCAVHVLGGVESATPKQIREVMNVEGLTINEVKSHLQKYRLYIRKLRSPAQQSSYSWLTLDNRRAGGLMPVIAYPRRTQQIPNVHLAGGWI